MRTYGGRRIKSAILRQVSEHRETRDAILWDVDSTNRYCRVKIQGSDTLIKAHYPENWEATPVFLKPGNAVRISHPGGNKGRIEVVGHGLLIPTAIPGGTGSPAPTLPGDTVLTGLNVIAASPAAMSATVLIGTYRIGGIVYVLGGIEMDRADVEMDRADITLDGASDSVSFDAASASYFRYDLIVVGTDGDAHAVKGANASVDPVMPTAPADHVVAGWVLLYPGLTEITQADINRMYVTPAPTELRVVTEDDELSWGDLSTYFAISIRDQYGRVMSGSYQVTLAWTMGNGTLNVGSSSQDESASFVISMTGQISVYYTRNGLSLLDPVYPGGDTDSSPFFSISESATGFTNAAGIKLLNIDDSLMF